MSHQTTTSAAKAAFELTACGTAKAVRLSKTQEAAHAR
jgi:hypothetical protein